MPKPPTPPRARKANTHNDSPAAIKPDSEPGLLVPVIVAIAFLMEQLDTTIVTTAIPDMAKALHAGVTLMNLAVSAYVLTLAVFIPVSGWLADRFGARRIFLLALVIFTVSSALCGLATGFDMLVACRALQGVGGAMMTPVGRLILLRSFPRQRLVQAMTYATLPAIIGPILGPLLGGYLTTYLSWRWIFYVNIPFGVLGLILVGRFIRLPPVKRPPAFDFVGFTLFATGIGLIEGTLEAVAHLALPSLAAMTAAAVALLWGYARRSRPQEDPVIDLRLLRERGFGVATMAGGMVRMSMNGPAYLVPLMLQVGLRMTAAQSGLLTVLAVAGAPGIRIIIGPALRRFGFRRLLIGSAIGCSATLASFALIGPQTPLWWIGGTSILFGVMRSAQFMTSNTLAYADVPESRLSRATSLGGLLQQLTVSFGVSASAALLNILSADPLRPRLGDFHAVFLVLACLPLLALMGFSRLQVADGARVSGHLGPQAAHDTARSPDKMRPGDT